MLCSEPFEPPVRRRRPGAAAPNPAVLSEITLKREVCDSCNIFLFRVLAFSCFGGCCNPAGTPQVEMVRRDGAKQTYGQTFGPPTYSFSLAAGERLTAVRFWQSLKGPLRALQLVTDRRESKRCGRPAGLPERVARAAPGGRDSIVGLRPAAPSESRTGLRVEGVQLMGEERPGDAAAARTGA